MASGTTIERSTQTYQRFDLSVPRNSIRIPVPSGKALTILAETEAGTWSSRTLEVKHSGPSDSYSFANAKTIAAGGGRIQLRASEMEGVSEIEIITSGGSADASGTYATIRVIVEEQGSDSFTTLGNKPSSLPFITPSFKPGETTSIPFSGTVDI